MHWFKSYSDITGGVDLAYYWSCNGMGLRLHPTPCADGLFFLYFLFYLTALYHYLLLKNLFQMPIYFLYEINDLLNITNI